MPKKCGIAKTYSFSRETIEKMESLCIAEKRSQTNLIECLIDNAFCVQNGGGCYGERTEKTGARKNRPNSI